MLDKMQVNKYGLLGLILITTMIILRMFQIQIPEGEATNPILYRFVGAIVDPYVLLTVIPYILVSIVVSQRLNSRDYTKRRLAAKDRFTLQNLFIGLQIAMILWIIGLILGLNDVVLKIVYYVAALAIGLVIPSLLFSKRDSDVAKNDELEF